MLEKGSYVRSVMAPSRMGTIEEVSIDEEGETQFTFHLDERFKVDFPDVYFREGELEECLRPADAQVEQLNRLSKLGS
jgi:hypothetical protein